MKIFRRVLLVFFILIGVIVLAVGGYAGYLSIQYYRIEDNLKINIENEVDDKISLDTDYKISTYNIGFGAYLQDFTFFMDEGYDEFHHPVSGKESRAKSKDSVIYSTNGVISTINSYQPDFAFYQEADIKSDRSHKVNQVEMIKNGMNSYSSMFANNFHSGYLMYPITKPHGAVNAGILTMSKYQATSAIRKSFTVATDFISKISDLDRCFMASYLPIKNSNKYLVLVNLHMSAYDEGGKIRAKQIEELNSFLKSEYEKGNYIVAGGDFNHDLLTNNPDYNYTNGTLAFSNSFKQPTPDWLSFMFDMDMKSPIADNFKIIASDNNPSCRTVDGTWRPGYTYTATVDGFIVSNNIEVINHKNLLTVNEETSLEGFAYADHEPATMTFKLK